MRREKLNIVRIVMNINVEGKKMKRTKVTKTDMGISGVFVDDMRDRFKWRFIGHGWLTLNSWETKDKKNY